jgi:hypothetical protein
MTRLLVGLLLLLWAGAAQAQTCPGGSTCNPLETYVYGNAAAGAPYGSGLRIPVAPSATASTLLYIPANVLVTLNDVQTLSNKTLLAPALGVPASGIATNLTGLPLTTGVTGLLPVANGGTGTATPALVQGTNVTITGTWPNQTINSSAGGGGVTNVATTAPITGGAITTTGTIACATCTTSAAALTSGSLITGAGLQAMQATTTGAGVVAALAGNLSAAGGMTATIAAGTSALGTSAIASGVCATVVTTAATNTATTDVVMASFNGDPTAVTGYTPATTGMLTIISYPSANNVNFKVCNSTSASITPGAITLNWRVLR